MSFNHRVICKRDKSTGECCYAVYEVYYSSAGVIERWTALPAHPFGESFDDLKNELYLFQRACRLPVLELQEIAEEERLVEVGELRKMNEFDAFEFMDRSYVALDHVASYLGGHIMLKKYPRLKEAYNKAEDALSELYQAAGQYI